MSTRICPHCQKTSDADFCSDDGYQTVPSAEFEDGGVDPFVGTVFEGRYRVERKLTSGGMGTVYEATQLTVNRRVALKILSSELAKDLSAVARFQQEARAVAALRHPNTIRLIDFGRTEDRYLFLVMELLEGETLASLIDREAPLDPERVIHIGRQIFDALVEAHGCGIIHRDLKPENIFITRIGLLRDYVKLLDFGIAKVQTGLDQAPSITGTGLTLGSPGYMAPEQVQSQPVSPQSDIYSVGAILYEMLTGQGMFEAETPIEWLMAHIYQPPLPPMIRGKPATGPLVDLALACVEKNPEDRPASAAVVLAALDLCDGDPVDDGVRRRRSTVESVAAVRESEDPRRKAPRHPKPRADASRTEPAAAGHALRVAVHSAQAPPDSDAEGPVAGDDRRASRGTVPMWLPAALLCLLMAGGGAAWFMANRAAVERSTGSSADVAGGSTTLAGPAVGVAARPARVPPNAPATSSAGDAPEPTIAAATRAVEADASARGRAEAGDDSGPTASDAGGDVAPAVSPKTSPGEPEAATDAAPVGRSAAADTEGGEVAAGGAGAVDAGGDAQTPAGSRRVEVVTIPSGARVFRDREPIGYTPLTITWSVGEEPPALFIARSKYDDVVLRLSDGDDGSIRTVRMEYIGVD